MSSNCSQRSNKRKFHAILCDCAFCKAHTYPNPLPNWECFCPECTDIQPAEMDEALNTSDIVQFLRRANNVECCCGLCATCRVKFGTSASFHKKLACELRALVREVPPRAAVAGNLQYFSAR